MEEHDGHRSRIRDSTLSTLRGRRTERTRTCRVGTPGVGGIPNFSRRERKRWRDHEDASSLRKLYRERNCGESGHAESLKVSDADPVFNRTDIPGMGSFFWFKVPSGPIMACWQDVAKP